MEKIKNYAWLKLLSLTEYCTQINQNGVALITLDTTFEKDYCVYRIPVKQAKKKFPELTRNEFAQKLLDGLNLLTEDWS